MPGIARDSTHEV